MKTKAFLPAIVFLLASLASCNSSVPKSLVTDDGSVRIIENPDGPLAIDGLPWDDDGELRVAVFEGKSLRLREIYACPDAGMVLLLHPEKGRTELCGQERKAADYVKCDRE